MREQQIRPEDQEQEVTPRKTTAPASVEDAEDDEEETGEIGTAMVVTGFVGAVPLLGLSQWLGFGMPGFVVGGILAAIGGITGPLLFKRVSFAHHRFDFGKLFLPISALEAGFSEVWGVNADGETVIPMPGRTVEGTATTADVEQEDEEGKDEEAEQETDTPDKDDAFTQAVARQDVTPRLVRITVEQIVEHLERNKYEVYLGRSLTRPGAPAVKINFYKRHIKLIGASQHGKSSMAAALLKVILQTHDLKHVQVVLLDHENKTSRLFADAPHILKLRVDGEVVRFHARSYEEVLQHLEYLSSVIDYRYTLSEEELDQLPIVIVYLEEFIDLKDYFKQRMSAVGPDEKDQAKRDYARLVYYIKKLAARGLKVLVQLLMCAQVDYRDEDLQEALINVTAGMSFCVRVSAAQAAGFYRSDLLTRNAREDQIGQCVVEMPDCKDLILAPDFDLKAKLRALHQHASTQPQNGTTRLYALPTINEHNQEDADKGIQEESEEPRLSAREKQYEKVMFAWIKNIRSIRPMSEYLGLNFNQTRELLEEMDDKGLIPWRKSREKASV